MLTSSDAALLQRAIDQVQRVIVGQHRLVERLAVSLLAGGHCLVEGVPGLAKTLAAETLATVVGGSFVRLQFTPDLLPSDIVGTRIYRPSSESFDVELGPIFANFVLAESRERGVETWAGRTTYRLRVVDGEIRLAYKKVLLVNSDHALPTLAFLI